MGVPAIVGTGEATARLEAGTEVTVSCAEGETGRVYEGRLEYEETEVDPSEVPETSTKVMMNLASADAALRWWNLPVDGIGLARMEFIINGAIKVHPLALARFDTLEDEEARRFIEERTEGYEDKGEFFFERLAEGTES